VNTRLKILMSVGVIMLCLGVVAVVNVGGHSGYDSSQQGVSQEVDIPQYTEDEVIAMAKSHLETENPSEQYIFTGSYAEYLAEELWMVKLYREQPPSTCPRRSVKPYIIVYINEGTGVLN